MRAWHFSETAYPFLPPVDTYPSIRVSLPNRIYDPATVSYTHLTLPTIYSV